MPLRTPLRVARAASGAFVLVLAMAPLWSACSSDDSSAATGGAGSSTAGSTGGGAAGASGGAGAGGGTAGVGGTAGAAGAGETIGITGTTEEIVLGGASMPVADVTVCVLDLPSSCTKTDAAGSYVLTAPADVDSGVTFKKTGYLGIVRLGHNGALPMNLGATRMLPDAAAEAAAKAAGFPWPLGGKGVVSASAIAMSGAGFATIADATISIDPAAPTGPVYTMPDGTPDPSLQKTSDDGVAYFAPFAAGTKIHVTVAAPGKVCDDVRSGWQEAGGKGGGVIVADSVTFIGIACH